MVAFSTITKSLSHHIFKKPFFSPHFLDSNSQRFNLSSIRTLILQSEPSSVKLNKLSDLDSGSLHTIFVFINLFSCVFVQCFLGLFCFMCLCLFSLKLWDFEFVMWGFCVFFCRDCRG